MAITPFTPTKLSIRERILEELERRFKTVVKGAPPADPYPFEWGTVQRQPLGDQRRKAHELAIVDRAESKVVEIQNYHSTIEVELEFSSLIPTRHDPSVWANEVLAAIQRKINEDIYIFEGGAGSGGDQLALRIWEAANDYVVDDSTDRRIEGVVAVRILYKHGVLDPRTHTGV